MSPLDLQRIVDGELDHAARARVLETLGDDARNWRSLALALLEDQQWSRELRSDSFLVNEAFQANGSKNGHHGSSDSSSHRHQIRPSKSLSSNSTPSGSSWFTALAAVMLLGIGVVGGMWFRGSQSNDSIHSMANSVDNPLADRPLPMKMVLSGLGGSDKRPVEIPVVEANQTDPNTLWARDAQQLAALQQRLKREGYRMEWKPQFYSGRMNDGSQIVVPVHNVALKSVGL
jgi:hypothetical protein